MVSTFNKKNKKTKNIRPNMSKKNNLWPNKLSKREIRKVDCCSDADINGQSRLTFMTILFYFPI